jgi:hypothetical protein
MDNIINPKDSVIVNNDETINLKYYHIERCSCGCLFKYKYRINKYKVGDDEHELIITIHKAQEKQ